MYRRSDTYSLRLAWNLLALSAKARGFFFCKDFFHQFHFAFWKPFSQRT